MSTRPPYVQQQMTKEYGNQTLLVVFAYVSHFCYHCRFVSLILVALPTCWKMAMGGKMYRAILGGGGNVLCAPSTTSFGASESGIGLVCASFLWWKWQTGHGQIGGGGPKPFLGRALRYVFPLSAQFGNTRSDAVKRWFATSKGVCKGAFCDIVPVSHVSLTNTKRRAPRNESGKLASGYFRNGNFEFQVSQRYAHFSEDWQVACFCQRGPVFFFPFSSLVVVF